MVTYNYIGRIIPGAAGITYPGTDNTIKAPEPGVRTPESAEGKCSGLHIDWQFRIYSRNLPLTGNGAFIDAA